MAQQAGRVLKPLASPLRQMWRHAVRRVTRQHDPPAPPAGRRLGIGHRGPRPIYIRLGKHRQRRGCRNHPLLPAVGDPRCRHCDNKVQHRANRVMHHMNAASQPQIAAGQRKMGRQAVQRDLRAHGNLRLRGAGAAIRGHMMPPRSVATIRRNQPVEAVGFTILGDQSDACLSLVDMVQIGGVTRYARRIFKQRFEQPGKAGTVEAGIGGVQRQPDQRNAAVKRAHSDVG